MACNRIAEGDPSRVLDGKAANPAEWRGLPRSQLVGDGHQPAALTGRAARRSGRGTSNGQRVSCHPGSRASRTSNWLCPFESGLCLVGAARHLGGDPGAQRRVAWEQTAACRVLYASTSG